MITTIVDVANLSTRFERCNTDLKRRYLIENIEAFNKVATGITVRRGTFGTGYPFYVLNADLTGKLPVIQEQIRYNEELLEHAMSSKRDTWSCGNCLPDMDLWLICEDGKVEEAQGQLEKALKRAKWSTSDVDPLQTIQDIREITESLEHGIMPQKFLPVDV